MLKQHRKLSMFVRRTIETHEEARIRPNKTYQSFVAAAGSRRELGFIEKDVRNYITRKVWNIFEEDDAKEFEKKYGLGGNKWLSELYEDRHIWIPVYLDHHFWTGMRSTQRSESMHSFFNKFITRNSSLRQFVKQYDNCLASREQAVREFDAADFHTVIPCFTTYEVIEQVSNSTFNKFVVTYDAVSRDVKCHCLLFESRGILCLHSLSVLSFERVDNVTPKYILERWSKNTKRRHTHIKSSQDEPLLGPRSKRFDELVFRSHNICEFASESEELTGILHRAFDKLNFLDSRSSIQSSSTLYNAPDMNYPREDYTSFSFY
ncbi:hypothetical protein Ahy_A02g009256 [Arachis hypogaea]|uniref:Protein FAR1-RELATED SEQUENCE n=1 Tax=Arachis hypogaea TaxID=3818 RepID=A0A445EGG4_ARAHY|nr:hypothetical protein Ahy_A02g009256 [Arachis hypogaea]